MTDRSPHSITSAWVCPKIKMPYKHEVMQQDELRKYMLENITEEDFKRYQEEEKKSDPQ